MNKLIRGFVRKCKRFGFTLAEALIVTVMAGYSILPILGTMQNASNRAEAYDHNSKMVQYTRSRLTKEIANASFDHRAVSTDDTYHYIVYFDPTGDEEKAVRMEIPETSVTPEELRTVDINSTGTLASEACTLLGLSTTLNSAYLKIIYAYKTSVQTNDGILISDYTEDTNYRAGEAGPKGLMGIVVTTRLIEEEDFAYNEDGYMLLEDNVVASDTFVAPVSNFSLVNLPAVSDEYIWVCDSLNLKLIAIDPVTKTVASTIVLPRSAKKTDKPDDKEHDSYRPWRIALHPSGKIMAVLLKNNIMYVNLDKKSPDYGKCKKQLGSDTNLAFCNPDKNAESAIKDGGMAFRPDGKYLFFTKKEAKTLIVFKFDYTINSSTKVLDWSSVKCTEVGSANLDGEKNEYVGLVPSSNGYLYLAYKDKNLGVYRFSMYPKNNGGDDDFSQNIFKPEKIGYLSYEHDLKGIAVSSAGTHLAVILDYNKDDKKNVLLFDANTGALLDKQAYEEVCRPAFVANANASNDINDRTLTLNVTNKECKEDVIATSLAIGDDRNENYGIYKSAVNNGGPGGHGGGPADKKFNGFQMIPSPIPGELVITEKEKPYLVFTKSNNAKAQETQITNENKLELGNEGPKNNKSIADIAANPRDILAVSSTGTITLYDMNIMKEIEDNRIIATDTPTDLSMSPNGELLIGGYGAKRRQGTPFYISDYNSGTDLGSWNVVKSVFDDRPQNMLFFLEEDSSAGGNKDCVWNTNEDYGEGGDWACPQEDSYFRGDFDIDPAWKRLDIIGLPKGGYMSLFGKTDGTSMVEWVGRIPREYPVNANKYSLFARWVSQPSNLGQRIVPDYTPDSFSEDAVDGNTGFIAVETSKQFQVNDVVKFCDVRAGSWSGGETRYITPVLVSGTTESGYTIKDWTTTSIGLNSGEVKKNVKLIWANGGKIAGSNYFVGFWNGGKSGSGTGNAGVVALAIGDKNYSFYSDCGKDDSSNPVSLGSGDIKLNTPLYNHPSAISGSNYSSGGTTLVANWRRKYAINFKTEGNSNSSSFPPSHSKKLAVTYDMGTLAVLSGEDTAGGATPTVSLYDFNNGNFLNETQIEGMLVDYREKMQTGAYDEDNSAIKSTPDYSWPNEQESLFKKVANNCGYNTTTMKNFKSVTTKYDSFKAFNAHPGNYHLDDCTAISGLEGTKALANKRFFGYIRDDKDFTLLQGLPSEDSRFFYENSLLGGRLETGEGDKLYDTAFSIGLAPYQSGLLQLDQTSNGGGSWSAIFLGRNGATNGKIEDNLSAPSGNDISKNNILTKDYEVCGWNTLKSNQTYILKNQPTFMKAFDAKTQETPVKTLGVESATMMFSRDRANPVLYITDKVNNCFWAIGNKSSNDLGLVRFNLGATKLTGAMALSCDGTKLFLGCANAGAGGGNNEIRAFNIAMPDGNTFRASKQVVDISANYPPANPGSYTAYLGAMSVDNEPVAMASKPFVSYSGAGSRGIYKSISNSIVNAIDLKYNGSTVVASGGLYIFPGNTDAVASRTIVVFNPADNSVRSFPQILKSPAPYSPITCYDDTLYIMGDDNNGTKPTNRVQSFNVNTKKAKTSLVNEDDGFNDEYMVNYLYNDDTKNLFTLRKGESGISDNDPEDIFDNDNNSYFRTLVLLSDGESHKWVSYTFPNNIKATVNKVIIHNHDSISDNKLKDWALYGGDTVPTNDNSVNYSANYNLVLSGTCATDNDGPHEKSDKTAGGAYSTYLLYLKSAKDGGGGRGVSNLELWRTGVKRLTPQLGSQPSSIKNKTSLNSSMVTNCEPFESMTWSSASTSEYNLSDIFTENKQYSNNKNYISTSGAGYESNKAKPWIITSFKKQEAVCAVRYANAKDSNKSGVRVFRLYGSNDSVAPSATDTTLPPSSSAWVPIGFAGLPDGNDGEFTGPNENAGNTYITAEIKNPTPYKHYLFQVKDTTDSSKDLRLVGFEMFSSNSRVAIDDDYLTGLETDNRGEVNVGAGACCATPYGLVYTGGHVKNSNVANYATNTALLYWPHAIDKFDGAHYKNGISRTLPSLNGNRFNHAMVWHKGKIYCVGGAINGDHDLVDKNNFFEFLPTMDTGGASPLAWKTIGASNISNPDSSMVDKLPRYYMGCCSYGDEIFIFGGIDSTGNATSSAYAYNTETGDLRELTSLSTAMSPCCAVVYGSKIYILGKAGSKTMLYEYTP